MKTPTTRELRRDLLAWFDLHARALPWRTVDQSGKRDPYRVWVSEILLQQTQVSRGRIYFENFVTQFPDVAALAAAPIDAVLKAWEGCGYYARARNLHKAAQRMAQTGVPTTYEGWLTLPGVGPYTAAAISSLAFGEERAVNDGNVRRVLARLYAEHQPTGNWVQDKADALLATSRPGDWNEALDGLGGHHLHAQKSELPALPVIKALRGVPVGAAGKLSSAQTPARSQGGGGGGPADWRRRKCLPGTAKRHIAGRVVRSAAGSWRGRAHTFT